MTSNEFEFRARQFELKSLVWFFIIAFGWSWLLNSLFISGILEFPDGVGTSNLNLASVGFVFIILIIMPFGPTISAFVVTVRTEGREGMIALWKRFWSRRFTPLWLVVTLLFFPLLFVYVRFTAMFLFSIEQPEFLLLSEPWLFIPPFLASILHGGLSEEFGWRGYALTGLQARFDATSSSIIMGIVEGLWHLPLAFMPGYAGWEGRALIIFFVWWIPVSIFRTWIYNNTNGSVLAAVLFHAMGNTVTLIVPINIIQLIPGGMGYIYLTIVYIPVVLIVLIIYGHKNLVRLPKMKTSETQYTHMYLEAVISMFRRKQDW
jgi:membrane protease YdiL (CAAX protease family)